ncbi:TonB-dependent receptor [Sphingopyxis sp. J-6]|uniref:TonB-dependent receptor n=1 Tax=Sphingopyxis sp. J-6 TaxID=3122054 RepID=UPI003983FAE2
MTRTHFFAIASSMAAIIAATPASAQESGAAGADNEIVVTANKREENLFDVPSSVSAVSDQFIDRIRANNLSDIGAYVPGLNVQPSGGDSNRLIVRGLSTGSQDLSPTVGVYVDDAPFGASTGLALGAVFSPDLDPSDLARVEVLRGPQGTLYGANTLGGLVKFVTKAPDLSNFSGHASIDLSTTRRQGADDPFRTVLRGGMNLPIVQDIAALRVSGFYDTTNGTLTDVRTGRDSLGGNSRKGVRAKLLVEPTDNLSITLSGAYARNNSPRTLSLTADAQTLEPTYGDYADYAYSDSYSRSRYYVLQGNIRYEFANGISLSSTTSYSDFKVDLQSDLTTVFQPAFRASPSTAAIAPFLQFSGPVRPVVKRTTQELRLASPSSGSFEWLVGFFYDDQDSNYLSGINSTFNFGAAPPPALAPIVGLLADYQTVTTINHYKEYSGFANAKLSITPTIDLGAGVRYSHNKQAYTSARTGFLVLVGALPASGGGTSSDDVWTASFDASWHFAADSMLYARAARGYRPGGPTATGTSFDPDTTWNYEAGVKSSMMDGKLRTSLAGFFVDWDNIQVNFFNGTNTVIGNAGSARSMGAEFEGSYSPVDGLTLGANLTYTDTKITSLLAGQTTGAALGDELPYVSKWAGALRADYYFPVAGTAGGNLGASLRYRSAFDGSFPGDTGSTFYRLPETAFVDLRAGVELNEGFSVNLQVLNVTDSRKLTSASRVLGTSEANADLFGQPASVAYAPGRTFTISLAGKF